MISLVLLIGILGLLFLIPFAANRRFGVMGLGLAAGSILSANWTGTLTPFIEQQGVVMVAPPLAIVVATTLILLPPLVLLFGGPSYRETWQRIVGAIAFAVLAFAFLVQPLALALQLDNFGAAVIGIVSTYDSIIIVVGIIGALTDMLLMGRRGTKREK